MPTSLSSPGLISSIKVSNIVGLDILLFPKLSNAEKIVIKFLFSTFVFMLQNKIIFVEEDFKESSLNDFMRVVSQTLVILVSVPLIYRV